MINSFWDYYQNEWLPGFESFLKNIIGEFTKPIRLAFVKPTKAPHIKKSLYFKKGGPMVTNG